MNIGQLKLKKQEVNKESYLMPPDPELQETNSESVLAIESLTVSEIKGIRSANRCKKIRNITRYFEEST